MRVHPSTGTAHQPSSWGYTRVCIQGKKRGILRDSRSVRQPCSSQHAQVDGAGSCQDLTGETSEHCLAVGYSQTAISVTCGGSHAEDDHCGTFLELHMAHANYYVGTEEVIAEVHLLTENVTVRPLALALVCLFVCLFFGHYCTAGESLVAYG